jgi:cell division protein FtsZ
MISYSRDPIQEIPASAVKIVGLGGAGANMLERIALDSLEGGELIALNTDIRTLGASLAKDKVQLGSNLTKGLGTGGDPDLGQQAVLEAETEVRAALKGQKIVFLCVGLGGGTGSGAAPIIARIAREEGAFVIVFATMPFLFEGQRRRQQAETSLNQLAVLSNALVTFDNNRMGELVLARQGIHEAFGAADKMIFESIKAVIRLVTKPGLIHVGLDELITALRTTRSRCLFGSGIADGKDRASKALRNALSSPLLDQGALLKDAQSVLVHLSGGESLTLFEIELLMQSLQKHIPDHAQILFGAAIDPSMGDQLSITLISSLPEESLAAAIPSATPSTIPEPVKEPAKTPTPPPVSNPPSPQPATAKIPEKIITEPKQVKVIEKIFDDIETPEPTPAAPAYVTPAQPSPPSPTEHTASKASAPKPEEPDLLFSDSPKPEAKLPGHDRPFAEPELISTEPPAASIPNIGASETTPTKSPGLPAGAKATSTNKDHAEPLTELKPDLISALQQKTGVKPGDQDELSFKKTPRGRFEGENPNVVDGEDLDLPPFLRKKKR